MSVGGAVGRLRARVCRHPAGRLAWRLAVGVIGTTALVLGVVMIPGPGQGWAVVFLGLAILSTEFSWAARLRSALWHRLTTARVWYAEQGRSRRAVVLAGAASGVLLVATASVWLSLAVSGVPSWLPTELSEALGSVPGLGEV